MHEHVTQTDMYRRDFYLAAPHPATRSKCTLDNLKSFVVVRGRGHVFCVRVRISFKGASARVEWECDGV